MPKVNARYVDTPSAGFPVDEVPLKKHSEDAVNRKDYSSFWFRSRVCHRDSPEAFTESLILAQDERWRRA